MLYRLAGSSNRMGEVAASRRRVDRTTRTVSAENIVVGASDQGHERCGGSARTRYSAKDTAMAAHHGTTPRRHPSPSGSHRHAGSSGVGSHHGFAGPGECAWERWWLVSSWTP
jgi:hypothetical protein